MYRKLYKNARIFPGIVRIIWIAYLHANVPAIQRLQVIEKGLRIMPKDSQPDNKKDRMKKANGQTPITRENQNKNKNAKRQSIPNNNV